MESQLNRTSLIVFWVVSSIFFNCHPLGKFQIPNFWLIVFQGLQKPPTSVQTPFIFLGYTWQFCWCPFFGMVSSRDPNSKANRDRQRSGIKRSLAWITWYRSLVDGASTKTQTPRSTSQFGEPMGGVWWIHLLLGNIYLYIFPSKLNHKNVGKYTSFMDFMDSMGIVFQNCFVVVFLLAWF